MLRIRPFRALRPAPDFADDVHIYHSDAGDPNRYKAIVESNPYSMLNVSHAELFFPSTEDPSSPKIREKAQENLHKLIESQVLIADEEPCFYIYRLSMANHSQTGLITLVDIRDYIEGRIKDHELTREDKVHTQANVIHRIGGNIEPILLTYNSGKYNRRFIEDWAYSHDSTYDILDESGVRHEIWRIADPDLINLLIEKSSFIDALYICDGHHRIAASKEYYLNHKDSIPGSLYFLGVIFPTDEMLILDYNRAVKDLNGLSTEEFLDKLNEAKFRPTLLGPEPTYPESKGQYTMVLDDMWYALDYLGERNIENPVEELDVSILQHQVFTDILKIGDPQTDPRLSFISGTKGLGALQDATHNGMKASFALDPPDIEEIMAVANADLTMPPKSTCFEPKPMSGLIMYRFEE